MGNMVAESDATTLASPDYLILGEVEAPTGSLCEKLERLNTKAKIHKNKGGGRCLRKGIY